MSIDYRRINNGNGWDTNTYINPSNMNHMENGIKSACDGVDNLNDTVAYSDEVNDLKMLGWTVPKEMPIKNYTDENGIFHQRVGRVDLGSIDFAYASEAFYMNALTATIKKNSRGQNICFSKEYTNSGTIVIANMPNKTYQVFDNGSIYLKNTSYTDATDFKSAMSGVYLYYELATEIQTRVDGNELLGYGMRIQTIGNLVIRTLGKLVTINGYAIGLSLSTSDVTVGNLRADIPKPYEVVRAVCNCGDNAYTAQKQGYININRNGEIKVSVSSGTATSFYVSLCYIGQ